MQDLGWRWGSCPAARRGARLRAGLTPASASNTLSCLLEMLHSKQLRSIKMLIDSDHGIYRATYNSAMAQLERARASVQLAEAQNKRAESLIKTGAISTYPSDTRSAALGQTSADVHAAVVLLAGTALMFNAVPR